MAGEGLPAASVSKWTGLYRAVDPFAIPPGAMAVADNVVIPGASLLQPRRGFSALTTTPDWAALGSFGVYVMGMTAADTAAGTGNLLYHIDPVAGTSTQNTRAVSDFTLAPLVQLPYGQLPAAPVRSRFVAANGNLYETANFGTARLTSPSSTWTPAVSDTPYLVGTTYLPGTFLPSLNQVGYCATYRYEDANGNVHRGPPSNKFVFNNTVSPAAACGVALTATMTSMVLPGTVVEIWRTFTAVTPSDGSDGTGPEFFKIAELAVSTTVGANGYVEANGPSYTDNTPDTPFLVEPLYTNPTTGLVNGLGVANANTPPPTGADFFPFKGRYYFANTQEVERLTLQVIGTGSGGIVNNDTFFMDGAGFIFKDSVGAVQDAAGNFEVQLWYIGGSHDKGSVSENLRFQAISLADTMNVAFGTFYRSGRYRTALASMLRAQPQMVNGLGGYVEIERLIPGASGFSATPGVGAGEGFNGLLVVNNASDPNRQPANLMQSAEWDPESFPAANVYPVGQLNQPILRAVPLRDSCLLFKGGGDGLWKFTDDGTGLLTIGPLDQTVNLIAPETAVALDNSVFCLTDKGVLRITDGGAPDNVSNQQIQDDLQALIRNVGPATMAALAFGVAYESERTYVLALPESANSTSCTVQYIYNLQTNAWTRWTLPVLSCGFVSAQADDILVFGLRPHGTTTVPGTVWLERKTLTDDDYQDPGYTKTVPGVGTYSAASLTFTGDVTGTYAAGDLIRYNAGGISTLVRITDVTLASGAGSTALTLDQTVTWTAGDSFSLLKGIQTALELLPLVDGDPLYEKQWQNAYFFFRRTTAENFDVSFSTEKQAVPQVHTLAGQPQAEWLYSETLGYGLAAWGSNAHNAILKMALDQAAARSSELTLRLSCGDALAGWQLSALRIPYDPATMRLVK